MEVARQRAERIKAQMNQAQEQPSHANQDEGMGDIEQRRSGLISLSIIGVAAMLILSILVYSGQLVKKAEEKQTADALLLAAKPQPQAAATRSSIHDPRPDEGFLIPSSRPGDAGRYYIVQISKAGKHGRLVISKRVGLDDIVYTSKEFDCRQGLMRDLGEGESANKIKLYPSPTKWYAPVAGSSADDYYQAVCL